MKPYLLIAALIACILCAAQGYRMGAAAARAKHDAAIVAAMAETIAAGEREAAQELARLNAENEARLLARALEDAAYAEPATATCGLPRSRVLRLQNR